jgi:hypothetical protein
MTLVSPTAGRQDDLLTQVLGMKNQSTFISTATSPTITAKAPNPCNTEGPQNVFISSRCFAEGNGIGTGAGIGQKVDQNIIDMIPLNDVFRGRYGWYQPKEAIYNLVRYKHHKDISRVDIELTDSEGKIMALPDNYHVTIVLRLHYNLMGN